MSLKTTDTILAIWERWAEVAVSDHPWGDASNPDPPDGTPGLSRNSIADAEQLECLLLPQFSLGRFDLAEWGEVDRRVAEVLNKLSPLNETPDEFDADAFDKIEETISAFLDRNSVDGQPAFGAGSYLSSQAGKDQAVSAEEMPPLVDAYTLSLSVCIQSLHLTDRWREHKDVKRQDALVQRLQYTRERCELRLTAAMLGLCRSFASNALPGWDANVQRPFPNTPALRDIQRRLRPLERRGTPFECGWSWGATPPNTEPNSPERDYLAIEEEANLRELTGGEHAQDAPYLYFTVTAMEGISDLFSPRLRGSDVLNRHQAFLQSRLRFYSEATALYWADLVFEDLGGRWAIEELPWRTADGSSSDYWSLYLLLIATSSTAVTGRFADEERLERLLLVLEELAQRARLTREPHPSLGDPALNLHAPSKTSLNLALADPNDYSTPRDSGYEWWLYDFAPKLLKLTARVLGLARDRRVRERARELADAVWDQHLKLRRFDAMPRSDAWDDLSSVFPELEAPAREPGYKVGSWYITERVIEGLVAVGDAEEQRTFGSETSREVALEMLEELRWLARNRLTLDTEASTLLEDAEGLIDDHPSAAIGLLTRAAGPMADKLVAEKKKSK